MTFHTVQNETERHSMSAKTRQVGANTVERGVDVNTLAAWMKEGGGPLVIIDVREPSELNSGMIAGARAVPLGRILEPAWEMPAQNARIVVYCQSGVRSQRAAQHLAQRGRHQVHSLEGGVMAWTHAGMPLHSAPSEAEPALSREQQERYSRNLRLAEVGEVQQRRLLDSRMLIVGLGGLGTPAALYLAAAGVGTLGLVDDDRVELSNLQRQILHTTARVGQPKVESAAESLNCLNSDVKTIKYALRLNEANAREIMREKWDVVLDGSDNYVTRYWLNDLCCQFGVPCIFGSVQGFEGRLLSVIPGQGACYRCAFPKAPPSELNCSCDAAGVLGVLPGLVGVLQATEALKIMLGIGEPLMGKLLHYDALSMRFATLRVPRNPDCASCGKGAGATWMTTD